MTRVLCNFSCSSLSKYTILYIVLLAVVLVMFVISLCVGSVDIPLEGVVSVFLGGDSLSPAWHYILMEVRLPQALVAMLCGGALAVSGLLLQTCFGNDLAGPDVFGVSSGASLGVAVVMLLMGGTLASLSGYLAVVVAAFVGAMAVTLLLLYFVERVSNRVMLLIVGLMLGYLASSVVTLLNSAATADGLRSYVFWGMAGFGALSGEMLPLFSLIIVCCLLASYLLVKPLDALLLGDDYAESLGVSTRRVRRNALVLTGLLTATTVAFCGPVSFIGLAVPHLARLLLRTSAHSRLLPATLLCGSSIALVCNIICSLPCAMPLNAVTPLLGAPVIIYVIVRKSSGGSGLM